MARISVKVDEAQLARIQRDLGSASRAVKTVMRRAVNKVAVGARAQIVRRVAVDIAVKQSELRARNIKLRRASYSVPEAVISVTGKRLSLLKLGSRQLKMGVKYRISRKGGWQKIPQAFQQDSKGRPIQMKSGHKGVFIRRKGQTGGRIARALSRLGLRKKTYGTQRVARLPIDELRGPSVPQVFTEVTEFARGVLETRLASRLMLEVDRQMLVVMQGKAPPPAAEVANG